MCTPMRAPTPRAARIIASHRGGLGGRPAAQCTYEHAERSTWAALHAQPLASTRSYASSTHAMHAPRVRRALTIATPPIVPPKVSTLKSGER